MFCDRKHNWGFIVAVPPHLVRHVQAVGLASRKRTKDRSLVNVSYSFFSHVRKKQLTFRYQDCQVNFSWPVFHFPPLPNFEDLVGYPWWLGQVSLAPCFRVAAGNLNAQTRASTVNLVCNPRTSFEQISHNTTIDSIEFWLELPQASIQM